MEIKKETYHNLGDTTDRLMFLITDTKQALNNLTEGINQIKEGLQIMEQCVMQQKKLLLSIIIEAPFPQPKPKPFPEEESTTEEEETTPEEEQKAEEEEEEEEKHEEEEQKIEEEEEEEEQSEEEDQFIYDDKEQKAARIITTVPIAATSEKPYARKPYKVLLQVSPKAYHQYAYLFKKLLKMLDAGKQFEGQQFQHHLACITFVIKTKISDAEQLFQNTKTAAHWGKKLKKTEGYKNKEARKFADKLLENLRKMKSILKEI